MLPFAMNACSKCVLKHQSSQIYSFLLKGKKNQFTLWNLKVKAEQKVKFSLAQIGQQTLPE